jgi:phosphate transport system substrate-binding protein
MRRPPNSWRVLAVSLAASSALVACGGADNRVVPLPECLDLGAVYALTGPESIGVFEWQGAAALAEELGSPVADELPNAPLTIFGPGEESGTFDSFSELAIEELAAERGVPDDEALPRPDYISSPNDNVIIDGVAGSAGSFGWVGHAFARENQDTVRSFAVAGLDGRCVTPTDDAIASGEYPLARDLFIYVNLGRARGDEAVRAYVDAYLGDAGRDAVSTVGYVSLEDGAWEQTRAAWTEAGGAPGDPAEGVNGDVTVSGSSTVEPISSLIAERFSAANPNAGVSVDGPGTGDGFELFCDGDTDISDASRPIEPEEAEACAEAGVEYVELKIGIDGLSLVTREDP